METNTQQLVDLYNSLGQKVGPDGNPILSITQVQQTTTTTYMNQRTFDPASGVEKSPILTEVDVQALQTSLDELSADTDTINAIESLLNQASPSTPVQIKVGSPIIGKVTG